MRNDPPRQMLTYVLWIETRIAWGTELARQSLGSSCSRSTSPTSCCSCSPCRRATASTNELPDVSGRRACSLFLSRRLFHSSDKTRVHRHRKIFKCETVVGSWVGISQFTMKSGLSRSALLLFCFVDQYGKLLFIRNPVSVIHKPSV